MPSVNRTNSLQARATKLLQLYAIITNDGTNRSKYNVLLSTLIVVFKISENALTYRSPPIILKH